MFLLCVFVVAAVAELIPFMHLSAYFVFILLLKWHLFHFCHLILLDAAAALFRILLIVSHLCEWWIDPNIDSIITMVGSIPDRL